jgi:2-C-methyl-D-erythritol 2,4-cyclodiphosphate synthase
LKSTDQHLPAQRVGLGYDAHRLVHGRALILGGVEIPSDVGLEGHSDADVLLHAICDALLGAMALGDIGVHFPNSDTRYRNISSLLLLGHVAMLVSEHGYRPVNIDATVVLERPQVAPHVPLMRQRIAETVGIPQSAVSIKATTNEGLDAVGEGAGAVAHAIVLVQQTSSHVAHDD